MLFEATERKSPLLIILFVGKENTPFLGSKKEVETLINHQEGNDK